MSDPRGGEPLIRRVVVRCPGCGGESVYATSNPSRPFCSERCRNADLGAWASEGYRVPTLASEQDAEDSEPPSPA